MEEAGLLLTPFQTAFVAHVVLCSPGWPRTYYVAEDDLGILILLPPTLKYWKYLV